MKEEIKYDAKDIEEINQENIVEEEIEELVYLPLNKIWVAIKTQQKSKTGLHIGKVSKVKDIWSTKKINNINTPYEVMWKDAKHDFHNTPISSNTMLKLKEKGKIHRIIGEEGE